MKTNILLGGILLGAVTFLGAATNDLTTTLQRGLFEEEANQNLGAAIQAYQSVASQFDKDRKLAATAIFRLGECYRKQGNTNDAAAQYERILREFSDQPTLLTLSRQNLAALGSAAAAPAASVLSDAARQEQKRLLEEEIKLVQKELDMRQTQFRGGVITQEEVLTTERDLLQLKRQLAALDAGRPVPVGATDATANAAAAKAEVLDLQNQLAALEDFPKDKLRITVQQNYPNPVLTSLMQKVAEAEQSVATLRKSHGDKNVEVLTAETLVETVNKQIDEQVEAVLRGLEIKRDAAKRTAEMLTAQAATARPPGGESISSTAPATLVLSDAARQEQKRLLEEEIKLVQKHSEEQQKQMQAGLLVSSDDRLATERDLLHLRRQIAALDAGLPVSITATEATAPATSTEADEVRRVQALIKDSPDLVNAPDQTGETPLESAAAKGKLAVVKLLLDNGAAVDGLQQPGLTPLHYAAGNGHKTVVDLLLSKGAKPGAETEAGVTALHLAALKGYESVAKALLAAGAPVDARTKNGSGYNTPLSSLKYYVESGETPLHLAAIAGYPGMVELLVAKGAQVNAEDGEGRTPLSYAAQRGYQTILQVLLAAHANPNAGRVSLPLATAAFQGNMPALKLLLANGADPNTNSTVNWQFSARGGYSNHGEKCTPLFLAINQRKADAAKELLRCKADPNLPGPAGTPLLYEALSDAPTLEVLLEGGADPNQSVQGSPLLLLAVGDKNQRAVELLLAHHAEVNCTTPNGVTPLQVAAELGLKPIAEVLLKAGAAVNAKDRNGETPLHEAVVNAHPELVELLLANKADPNAKNNDGSTPLHLAVSFKQPEIVKLLLANKADPNERNNAGQTPLDLAKNIAQRPQPMRGSQLLPVQPGTSMPPGMTPILPAQPSSLPTAAQEQEPKSEAMADLLRRHGALDDLPHLDQIGVRRGSIVFSQALFTKGSQDWSQFTLLELLAVEYRLLAAGPDQGRGPFCGASRLFGGSRIAISRHRAHAHQPAFG